MTSLMTELETDWSSSRQAINFSWARIYVRLPPAESSTRLRPLQYRGSLGALESLSADSGT